MDRRGVPPTLTGSFAARAVALLLLGGLCAPPAQAGDRPDPFAGAGQLRSARTAARTESASGLTRDVGQIAIVEHDGSNYDMNDASGAPNYAARAAVARRFYEAHGDNYDFLVVFTNFEFSSPGVTAFMNPVRNDVRGIGIPLFDLGASFGSPGRLKGYIDMAAVSRYRQPPLSLDPGQPGYLMTLGVLAHEVGHQWLAGVRYRNAAGADVSDLIGRDGHHWSYLLDSDASFLFGSDWVPSGTGTFRAERIQETYSSLDLYLMGLLDAARVSPFTLLRNPAIDPTQVPVEGAVVNATAESLRVEQVVAAEGPRSPGLDASQKEFRLGFIFLTAPGVEPSADDLAAADRVRAAFAAHFFFHTRGVAIADTSLAESPPPPPAPAPDLDRAVAWLLARQAADGRWEDSPGTAARDTAAAVEALAPTLDAAGAVERARTWLWPAGHPTTDHSARRALALSDPLLGASQRQELIGSLRSLEASEGGFGIASGYRGDALDTALALRALAALGHPADATVAQAIAALAALRHASGGWAMVQGAEVSAVVTAEVVLALQDWPGVPQAQSLVAPALAALLTRRNADGGFGESPSTPYATALALRALLAAHAPANLVDGAAGWLQSTQHADGGWGGAYPTALVIAALRASQGPNLVVPHDSLHIDPPSATEGQVVAVSAVVRNAGHRVAGPQHVRLFDGDPGLGQVVGEMAVGALEVGESTPLHFDFDTAGHAGSRTLYVVADAAGEVVESREDDNAASRVIAVAGLLPDLELGSFDIVVSPYPPQQGETVAVSVVVHNRGQRLSTAVLLDVTRGDPRAGGQTIGRATVPPIPPAESRTVSIDWDTTGQAGTHELFASADADFRLPESDETNNEASQAVTVTATPASGVDLELAQLRAEPAKLSTIPQDGAVEALVRNIGSEAVVSVVALHDGGVEGPLLGERAVSLGPRSSLVITFPLHVTAPGSRAFVAVADPAGAVEETREDNNRASAALVDAEDTIDVEVPPAGVVPSSFDLTVGEVLTVGAVVRNRGTASVTDVPVILAHVTEGGPVELARRLVTLAPGASGSPTFAWTTSIVGESIPLAVIADPFRLLDELSEANNHGDFAVRVRPSALPNLAVGAADIHFSPDPPQQGASAIVSVLVRNTSAVAAPAFTVQFSRGDPDAGGTPIGQAVLPGVAAGDSAQASVTWSPVDAAGNALVFAVADGDGAVEEYDETDNRAFRPIGVQGLPDLVLTAGDVTLTPGFPRAGQVVGIAATVRNLGGQPSAAATLRAWEGEAGSGTVIGDVAIPALQPRQAVTLSLSWTPSVPPGEVVLTVAADAPDEVREADEGNNLARRQVVIQNADVYLTEPFFSPDGDGRKDATTLAWRATGAVNVVVSDSRGARVRTLATAAPAEGSAAWDGRDDRGRLLWDGVYTITVEAPGGVPLARTSAALDTNRSPIQDAAATGLVSLHNMTCRLPSVIGPAWMPAEDEALFIVPVAAAGLEPGLIRVTLGGDWSYVGTGPDPWYAHDDGNPTASPAFVSQGAVSPDGREALIRAGADLVAVDLASGERRVVVAGALGNASWSPDGRWIALGNRVVSRDGTQEAGLPLSAFEWSPDGEWLTDGRSVVRRDGSGERELPLPADNNLVQQVHWLGDGRVFVRLAPDLGFQDRSPDGRQSFLVDPDSGAVVELHWVDGAVRDLASSVHLTPNGGRAAYGQGGDPASVVREDGTSLRLVDPGERGFGFDVSPHDRLAFYLSDAAAQPGQACEGLGSDVFALSNLQNMTLDLQAARLPANNGLLLRGTAADRHLDHYQLEYATAADPAQWRPIGPASAVPVVDDTLSVWVPPAPGTYALRLRAEDLAGNLRSTTRVVAWDRTPSLANFAQSERLISPTGDGVKDAVHFSYLVLEPTTVEVLVSGPVVPGQPAALVKRLQLPHPQPGPAGFDWDGRDEGGAVVADGRYAVTVNDIPFRVDVDSTPPDLAWSYHGLGSEPVDPDPPAGRVIAERRWHVVDPHLAGWSYRNTFFTESGTDQVFEPERDAEGNIVYVDGVPRIRYEAGRPADTKLKDGDVEALGTDPTASLSATDHAGNRSAVPALPVAEKLFLLAAHSFPQADPDGRLVLDVPIASAPVALTPTSSFLLGETLRATPANAPADVRFEYRIAGAPQWTAGPTFTGRSWTADFDALALEASTTYQARFVGQGTSAATSEQFQFRVVRCEATGALALEAATPVPGSTLLAYRLRVNASGSADPIVAVAVTAAGPGGFANTIALNPQPDGSFARTLVGPPGDCDLGRISFTATLTGQSGATYGSAAGCRDLHRQYPEVCLGNVLRQGFPFCAASPERAYFDVAVAGLPDGAVTLRSEGVALGVFEITQGQAPLQVSIDARALPEGRVPMQARHQDGTVIEVAGPAADSDVRTGTPGHAPFIDKTPQAVDVLAPPELGRVCVSRDSAGHDTARIDLKATELGRLIEVSHAQYRRGEGPWAALQTQPATSPLQLPTGATASILWNVTGLPEGEYTVRLPTCDRAGHQATRERQFTLARTPPSMSLAADRSVFSPNGDGRGDATVATASFTQPLRLTVDVRRENATGPVVRHLVSDQPYEPGAPLFAWDGRDDASQVVADGVYAIVARGRDDCGNTATAVRNVEADTQPPLASVTAPSPGDSVAAGVDVRGLASDAHFRSLELAFGTGPAPAAWTVFFTSPAAVPPPGGLLGRWNAPAEEGGYVLRLQVTDKAENVRTVLVAVTVVAPTLLDRLTVTPSAFSPNGDGRADTATVEYVLRAPATVRLEVRAGDGSVVRTLVPAVEQPAGLHSVGWDGAADGGGAAPEGELQVHIAAQASPLAQESSAALILDRTAPVVSVTAPAPGAFVTPQGAVRGSVHDPRLFSFVVRARPPSGPEVEIGRGAAEVSDGELASLAALQDGAYQLTVLAEDAAANRSAVDVAVTVDAVAPMAGLQPLGAVVDRGAAPIDVRGTAADANLREYVLGFGAGAQPSSFVEIARAGSPVQGASLGQWSVASLPDGDYTLRLVVTDRAGQSTEARLTLALDGTLPVAALMAPGEGARLNAETDIRGSATDANLERWTLEMAPGSASEATQWTMVATAESSVAGGVLGGIAPLPPDGTHTLRLTVRDAAGHARAVLRSFQVDTVAPAAPAALQASVALSGSTADVTLRWDPVADADLAGYRVSRDGAPITPTPIGATSFIDAGRGDGSYRYEVQAIDGAGNAGAAAAVTVRVDVTPPLADITSPRPGDALSGSVDVRGTALSPDDFKEYRLLVGAGTAPASWTLLKRSSVPVAASTLGTWEALGEGAYVLALEAEDNTGNKARATVAVHVDNQAPSVPVLTSLVNAPASDALTAAWQSSPDPDVKGYLLYRNGRLANATGVVVGDLRPYLLPGPDYTDATLPDGEHCYHAVAMDQAGNLSPPSNTLCRTLDNRRPHALIVEPPDGTRFEFPVRVIADTPDRDVVSVQFQIKRPQDPAWQALGAADAQLPFEVTLDPASLVPGPYQVRAVARDAAGEDPSPAPITLVYGDTSAPAPPQGVTARVDGRSVRLDWSPSAEGDLAGYHVWRGSERITEVALPATTFTDTVTGPGLYVYRITAIDGDGNESALSAAADALVYTLALRPGFPVTSASTADLPGAGAVADTTIEIRRQGAVIAHTVAAGGGAFTVPVVPLLAGANVLTASGVDAAGNRSIPSDEAVVIVNAPPPPLADLEASVEGHDVSLSWSPVGAPDLFGYAVTRGPIDLTPPEPQTEHANVSASSVAAGFEPERAFDADPGTAWLAEPGVPAATWTVTFPEAVLVRKVGLTFAGAVPDYSIEALWEGRFLPLVRVQSNAQDTVEHLLTSPFATDALRVVLAGPSLGLAEVSVEVRGRLTPATSFQDMGVPDGAHEYTVRAFDRYGADGTAAMRSVDVGDVTAPAAPTGVSAVVNGADVLLAWNAAPEPDVAHYVVLRDALAIATIDAPAYLDTGLPNGTYRYAVVAVDMVGNRSAPSAELTATVATAPPEAPVLAASALPNGSIALAWTHAGAAAFVVQRGDAAGGPYAVIGQTGDARSFLDPTAPRGATEYYRVHAVDARGNPSAPSNEAAATSARTGPPAAPSLTRPTDADHPATVTFTEATIEGRGEPGSLVSVEANGTLRGVVEAGQPFAVAASTGLTSDAKGPVVSADGRRLAFAVAHPVPSVLWQDLETGASGSFSHAGADELLAQAFSADGHRLAYRVRACDGGACRSDLYIATLESGAVETVEDGTDDMRDAAWAPDGRRLAFTTSSGTSCALWVRELQTAETRQLLSGADCGRPRFAPDSTRIALVVKPADTPAWRLVVVDAIDGAGTVVADAVWPQSLPSWSPDGARVAFTSAASATLHARVRDLSSGGATDVAEPQLPTFDPQFDPAGGWISFTALRSTADGPRRELLAEDLERGGRRTVAAWTGQGNTGPLVMHAWTALHTLAVSFPDRVALFAAEGQFRLDGLRLGPGENVVLARATDAEEGLTSADSRPIHLTVPASLFADLRVTNDDVSTYPSIPAVGQGTLLKAHVGNAGSAAATDVRVLLTVRDAAGGTPHEQEAHVSQLLAGQAAWVTSLWTPAAAGSYGFRTLADPQDAIAESREDNNRADLGVLVAPPNGLVIRVSSDRPAYEANAAVLLTVRLTNGGAAFAGEVRTTVEAGPAVVTVIDSRHVTLAYGQALEFTLGWSTGLTYAGDYVFATRAAAPAGAVQSLQSFRILPDVDVSARLLAASSQVPLGQAAAFDARVGNASLNAPLDGAMARLRVRPIGAAPVFTSTTSLPRILPGASWRGTLVWPAAQPAGPYEAELDIVSGSPLATASATFTVVPPAGSLAGTLSTPAHVVRGEAFSGQAAVTNTGTTPLLAKAFAVEVAAGGTGDVLLRAPFTLDLPPGETRTATVTLSTTALPAGTYPVFLRAVAPALTLDRRTIQVHGPIGAPSIDSPTSGARVPTSHPTLSVNNAASPAGAEVAYEFQIFADAALTQPLPGAQGVPEGAGRTSWRVAVNLGEDRTFFWRTRAGDGTAAGSWSEVASFTVDEVNLVPSAPVPDSPPAGARVASRQPLLVVKNAFDLDLDPLTYDFRVAEDAGMTLVVTSVSDLPEGLGLTSWRVPETLEENRTYFWSARARDAVNESPWSEPISFIVDTVDESPGAPEARRPLGGATTATLQPELVVGNAADPEGQPLTYRFEVDVVASFDSPSLQVSPLVSEGAGETLWVPAPLGDNTLHYWRSAANDGHSSGPFAASSFFVNVANDPPGVPVPLFPANGATVGTATPELRVQNAVDPDHDVLTYEFVVTDEGGGTVVAGVLGVAEGSPATTWTVTPPLAENARFRWQARASDRQVSGGWSAPQLFRVNAIAEPPTAPTRAAPPEGAALDQPRPALVVANATSPDGLALTYTFELYLVGPNGTLVLRDSASGVAEGPGMTSFTPGSDLVDGAYRWRCRASDPAQDGPWMNTASFTVAVDRPPSAPTGVTAVPGDGKVTLAWTASPEPDVVAYRVYRAATSGGPYALRSTVTAPAFTDTGLANGVTVFYVVTAADAHFESARSGEVAATPRPPVIAAQLRFTPSTIAAECLLGGACWNDGVALDGECCPKWLYTTIELPAGHAPTHIDRAGVRLGGSAAPDGGYWKIVDGDGDAIPELELRFAREKLPPLLVPGANTVTVSGKVDGADFRGAAAIQVTAFDVELKITPTTLKKTSQGNDVEARLTFEDCVKASDVSVASLRLNGVVPVKDVVSTQGHRITVKFDRAAVAALLPVGDTVEVRVTGTVRGLAFKAVDHIRVIP